MLYRGCYDLLKTCADQDDMVRDVLPINIFTYRGVWGIGIGHKLLSIEIIPWHRWGIAGDFISPGRHGMDSRSGKLWRIAVGSILCLFIDLKKSSREESLSARAAKACK